jgi:predicted  nucleic acid-binding Zn-ribbon protein
LGIASKKRILYMRRAPSPRFLLQLHAARQAGQRERQRLASQAQDLAARLEEVQKEAGAARAQSAAARSRSALLEKAAAAAQRDSRQLQAALAEQRELEAQLSRSAEEDGASLAGRLEEAQAAAAAAHSAATSARSRAAGLEKEWMAAMRVREPGLLSVHSACFQSAAAAPAAAAASAALWRAAPC